MITLSLSLSTVSVVTAIDGATLLILNGFAFIDPSPMPNGERWYCAGKSRWNCQVCLHVNDDYELVCISNEHTHKAPVYEKTAGGLYVEVPRGRRLPHYQFIPSSHGKHYVLLVEGCKFNQTTSNGRYWNCSKRMTYKCKARARFDSQLNMIFYDGQHNHSEPMTSAAGLPVYNVSAAITQAFSNIPMAVVTLSNGQTLLIVNGFTFKREVCVTDGKNTRWGCNDLSRKRCDVYLYVNEKFEVVYMANNHTHEPTLCKFDLKSVTTNDFAPSEIDFFEPNLDDIYDDTLENIKTEETSAEQNFAILLHSSRGKPCLILNGFKYRKTYSSKNGSRWACCKYKNCTAFLFINHEEEITKSHEEHSHPPEEYKEADIEEEGEQAVVITSRKNKELLLYRNFTYRKHMGSHLSRWVCSSVKSCKAFITTNENNFVLSIFDEHCHEPPKYYLKDPKVDVAVISNLGTMLELNGYVYKKTDESTEDGIRWECGNVKCHAFLIMNDDDEIVSAKELHSHAAKKKWKMTTVNEKSKGLLVTSRNGNENLMYRGFAYRKKYTRGDKIRWVCATMKYCRACVHTNKDLLVLKAYQEHCHASPKYNYYRQS